MLKLHVLLKREDIAPARLPGKVVVVLDILFATTTIVHAFAQGVVRVWPTRDRNEAEHVARALDAPVLAGEYVTELLDGFEAPTPLALAGIGLRGRDLVYCTTNGTLALADAASAAHVYAGALGNGAALARHIAAVHANADVLIVCAGSVDRFNLEDFHGAGHMVSQLRRGAGYTLTDAAIAAEFAYAGTDSRTALLASRVGRIMQTRGYANEVEHACLRDITDVIPRLHDGHLTDARRAA